MNNDLQNILSNSNKDIDNQTIMNYLNDQMSAEEKHAFEVSLAGSQLLNDAVEGLQELKSKKDPVGLAEELNRQLKMQLEKKKTRKEKRKIREMAWIYIFIVIVLLVLIVGYIIITKFLS